MSARKIGDWFKNFDNQPNCTIVKGENKIARLIFGGFVLPFLVEFIELHYELNFPIFSELVISFYERGHLFYVR